MLVVHSWSIENVCALLCHAATFFIHKLFSFVIASIVIDFDHAHSTSTQKRRKTHKRRDNMREKHLCNEKPKEEIEQKNAENENESWTWENTFASSGSTNYEIIRQYAIIITR
jgi:mannitol-specific phosphotransferase system IIBC component